MVEELQYLYSNVILYDELLHIGLDMDPKATVHVTILPDGRMDRKNAARYTGLSEKTLAMYASRGTGPAFVKRGKVFYFQEDLDRWIREGSWSLTA
jgi:Helix-turn-helix domain